MSDLIQRLIHDELGHLANHDIHIRTLMDSIRYGAPPVVALCQTIVAMSGAVEAQRKTLVAIVQNSPHPVMIPASEARGIKL